MFTLIFTIYLMNFFVLHVQVVFEFFHTKVK